MTELTLISQHEGALKPLIEGAISEALRSTTAGIDRVRTPAEFWAAAWDDFGSLLATLRK
jgi:hypothetical protein